VTYPIKVLHTEWSDGWGGQEIRIVEEMKAVRELGVEVALACRPEAKIRVKAEEENIPVYTFPFRGNMDLKTLTGLITLIRKEHIDIVNTHSGKDTWVGGLAAKLSGAKFIRTRHLSNPINPSRLNFINSLADFIITTGEGVREEMIRNNRIAPEKILSIPTGVDEKRFYPGCCNRKKMRKKYRLPDDAFLVGIVAVLRSFKRHDLFLEAAYILAEKYQNIHFVIAGDGPQRLSIERMISEKDLEKRVHLLGHVDHPEEIYSALDLFVLSSDSKEGVPQSVIQGLIMGVPVIATDVGSTRDLYTAEPKNMYLIPPGDAFLLAQSIETLYTGSSTSKGLASVGPRSVRHFTRRIMAHKLFEIYHSLLGKR